ncbi:MAG: hypothetical protein RLO17_04390 [Cyclobacteriaceae bacterium]
MHKYMDVSMHILIVDMETGDRFKEIPSNVQLYDLSIIRNNPTGEQIYQKYYKTSKDKFRWSSKPVFMMELLTTNIDSLLYLDSDLYFFKDPSFLFDLLDRNNILLSPHFRCNDPSKDYRDYGRNNTHGLYNGGFVGARKNGIPALKWWADACEKVCEKNRKFGYYVDQSHLNLLPILFEEMGIIKHKGCNVANWNRITCPRSVSNGEVILDDKDPLIFIHFTGDTVNGILNGEDPLLLPYLQEYEENIREAEPDFRFSEQLPFWRKWIKF